MSNDDIESFFDEVGTGGGGAPGFKFEAVGSGVKGIVVDVFKTHVTQPGSSDAKVYKSGARKGQPIPQLNVTLQTELRDWKGVTKVPLDENEQPKPPSEDDGKRRVFLKYDMARAVGKAIQEAGATKADFREGAEIAIKKTGTQAMNGGEMPLYEARFKKGEAPATADDFDFGTEASTPAAESTPASDPFAAPTASDDEPPF